MTLSEVKVQTGHNLRCSSEVAVGCRCADGDDLVDDGPRDISLVGEVDLDEATSRAATASPRWCRARSRRRAAPTSFATTQIEALGDELRLGVGDEVVGLGGEADEHLTGALAGAEPGEDVGGRLEDDLGDAVALLQLAVGGGRSGGSRRRRRPSRSRRHRRPPLRSPTCISAAVSTAHDRRHRRASGRATVETSVTSAPRAAASAAMA